MPKHVMKPPGVAPPTVAEMDAAAKRAGLKTYPANLIRDLHDYANGGRVYPPSAYLPQARREAQEVLSDPAFKNEHNLPLADLETELTNNALWNHSSMGDFISGVDLSWFPGETPLEQSMQMLKMMDKMNRNSGARDQKERKFDRNDARQISQVQREVDKLTPEERKLIQPKKGIKSPFKLDLGRHKEDENGNKASADSKGGKQKSKDGGAARPDPSGNKSGPGKKGDAKEGAPNPTEHEEKKPDPSEKQDAEEHGSGSSNKRDDKAPASRSGDNQEGDKSQSESDRQDEEQQSAANGEEQDSQESSEEKQEDEKQSCCSGGKDGEEHDEQCSRKHSSSGKNGKPAEGKKPAKSGKKASRQKADQSAKKDGSASKDTVEPAQSSSAEEDNDAETDQSQDSEAEPENDEESGSQSDVSQEAELEDSQEAETAEGSGPSDQEEQPEADEEQAADSGNPESGSAHNRLTGRAISHDTDRMELAEGLMPGGKLRMMLDMSRQLDMFESIRISKRQGTTPDPEGEDVRRRRMKDVSEFGRIVPAELSMRTVSRTLFRYRLATHKCLVRERIKHFMRKQIIFILLDGSGSMGGDKHWRASGVVMNRLKAVLSGDAELWLSVFDTRMSKVHHAATEPEALDVIGKFMDGNYSGGGTNIGGSVLAAHGYIQKLMVDRDDLERPQLWVLTDEDQSISNITAAQVTGTKVNAMVFATRNKSMCDFAKATGGLAFEGV